LFANNEISSKDVLQFFERHSVFFQLTDQEKDLIWNGTMVDKVRYTWRVERLWALLWVLGKVDTIANPNTLCDTTYIHSLFRNPTGTLIPSDFMKQTRLRSLDEILDLTDLYLRLNWYCIEQHLNHEACCLVHSRVVYERLYALQWVLNYQNSAWDASISDLASTASKVHQSNF
jgi:hypothetical protein